MLRSNAPAYGRVRNKRAPIRSRLKQEDNMAGRNRARKQVLVTGAEGVIGTAIRQRLSDRYDLRSLTRRPRDFPSYVADIADLDAILPAFEGIDAVVHLAA